MAEKDYIDPQQLLTYSFKLGIKIFESGYKPNYIIGIWRGGAPVGIAVQELLDYLGVTTDHISIRTSSYSGITQRSHVRVHGLEYIIKNINSEDSLLIVDDVFDTGFSIEQVITELKIKCRKNTPEIKVATIFFKPKKNQTTRIPDFYLFETDKWVVFPHELNGLTISEIQNEKRGIHSIKEKLLKLKK